jgi:hypothetical protein
MRMPLKPVARLLAPLVVFTASVEMRAAAPFVRELSTDRPDTTESPYTVEASRWQVETEIVRASRDSEDGVRISTLALGATNLKYGLTDSADVQLVLEPYSRVRVTAPGGARTTIDGVGDTTVRLKLNFAGNDGTGTAFGVMPFVKLPTAARRLGNGHAEGGLIFPIALQLGGDWSLGLMAEGDVVRNDNDDGYAFALVTTASLAGEIAPRTGMFFELANEADHTRASTWATSFNTGITYALTPDAQLDAGVNLALTSAAEDRVFFLGASWRW